jgi:hypothetical protein
LPPHDAPSLLNADPRLTILIDAWDRVPEAIRVGIMAMIGAASKD